MLDTKQIVVIFWIEFRKSQVKKKRKRGYFPRIIHQETAKIIGFEAIGDLIYPNLYYGFVIKLISRSTLS